MTAISSGRIASGSNSEPADGGAALNGDIGRLIDEAIRLELNIAELYILFRKVLPEDAEFWWQLAVEEKNHAALLKSGKVIAPTLNGFPVDLLPQSLRDLEESNALIEGILRRYEGDAPSREEAFNVALDLERSAGESHYQRFMDADDGSEMARIFQDLNRDDKDHAARIVLRMREKGIPVRPRPGTGEGD